MPAVLLQFSKPDRFGSAGQAHHEVPTRLVGERSQTRGAERFPPDPPNGVASHCMAFKPLGNDQSEPPATIVWEHVQGKEATADHGAIAQRRLELMGPR